MANLRFCSTCHQHRNISAFDRHSNQTATTRIGDLKKTCRECCKRRMGNRTLQRQKLFKYVEVDNIGEDISTPAKIQKARVTQNCEDGSAKTNERLRPRHQTSAHRVADETSEARSLNKEVERYGKENDRVSCLYRLFGWAYGL